SSPQAVVLSSGEVMVAGGDLSGPLGTVEIWNAASHAWSPQPPLTFARTRFAAAHLATGEVLLFGGFGTAGFSLGNSEIWTPGAPGSLCTAGDDCRSGACDDGVCCTAACAGACQTCVTGTGACAAVTKADDPDTCTG